MACCERRTAYGHSYGRSGFYNINSWCQVRVSALREEDDALVVSRNLDHRLAPLQIQVEIFRRVVRIRTVFRQRRSNDQKVEIFLPRALAVGFGPVSGAVAKLSRPEVAPVVEVEMRQRPRSPEVPVPFASRQNTETSFPDCPNRKSVPVLLLLRLL